jgi:hypothetical protein
LSLPFASRDGQVVPYRDRPFHRRVRDLRYGACGL